MIVGEPVLRIPREGGLDPHLDHRLEREPATVRVAQDQRRDSGEPRYILRANI